ncbi:metal-sensitive transcriptional regulator [Mesobacillus sp. AQ2]|uniref:metal-sensitive transcriptional regulator n=1 Tax=Bacillaceae TaxID=186817 RepID=UPI0011A08D6D|nr:MULTISPECIES: metal-sensitive transcriptional regulator [Bacillaceae]MCM3122043.1 metal-sensitive transcriptional regulator [Mesobacillus sp. MER 33]MCM3232007.1 metal-sensitive transcriptional regulator [Mesobacillus sp. MER 48]WHX38965.1 metal-sensitive transcriptional regulator [Mesobacillus sp. AQ2]
MEYNKEIVNRLKRIEGQVRGSIRLLDEQEECKSVVTQLSAIRSAVDRTIALIVSKNLEQCLISDLQEGRETSQAVNDAVELLVKSRK